MKKAIVILSIIAAILLAALIFSVIKFKQNVTTSDVTVKLKENKTIDSVYVSKFDLKDDSLITIINKKNISLLRLKSANKILADSLILQRKRYEAKKTFKACDSLLAKVYEWNNGLQNENDSIYSINDTLILRVQNKDKEIIYLKSALKNSNELTTKATNIKKRDWFLYAIGSCSNFNAGAGLGLSIKKIGGSIKYVTNLQKSGFEFSGTYKIW